MCYKKFVMKLIFRHLVFIIWRDLIKKLCIGVKLNFLRCRRFNFWDFEFFKQEFVFSKKALVKSN